MLLRLPRLNVTWPPLTLIALLGSTVVTGSVLSAPDPRSSFAVFTVAAVSCVPGNVVVVVPAVSTSSTVTEPSFA